MRFATVRARPVAAAVIVLVLVCSAVAPAGAGSKAPAPYDVAVRVEYAERVGSESVREWAEREIARELQEAGCFASARTFRMEDGTTADLLMRLVIRDFAEKTDYETSLAQRDDPRAPPTERLRLVASLEVWTDMELWTLPDRSLVRARPLHLERGFRPALGQDAGYEVRRLLIEALAEELRRWACKGARKCLGEEIERAREKGGAAR